VPHRIKSLKKHQHLEDEAKHAAGIVNHAHEFLHSLEALREEIIIRDKTFKDAKEQKDSEKMKDYQRLAGEISQRCLDYGRELCEAPIPYWVDGDLSKEKIDIARHAYDVVRNKLCASLNVFDSDLLPNAKTLIMLAEGRM
jgi:hypothetical protein